VTSAGYIYIYKTERERERAKGHNVGDPGVCLIDLFDILTCRQISFKYRRYADLRWFGDSETRIDDSCSWQLI